MGDDSKFNPALFYRAMDECRSLLVAKEEVTWTDRHVTPERVADVLLAFGCAVQHTPHLMLEATAVLSVLGIDFQAVTGRQFCCGRPFQRLAGDQATADRISTKSYERFLEYGPKTTVQWCGACMLQYQDVISKQQTPPFDVIHVTRYLAEQLRARGASVPWVRSVNRRVVLHHHSQFLPQQDLDTAYIIEILRMVPGVDVAGLVEPPSVGAPCSLQGPAQTSILIDISTDEYRSVQRELEDQAFAVGADTLITPYHKCQMEWSKFASRRLAVREWMSVVAEGLGVGYADRYAEFWHVGDPAEIVRRSESTWESWGLTREEAFERAERHFVPRYAVDVHRCDCGGRGCGVPSDDEVIPRSSLAAPA